MYSIIDSFNDKNSSYNVHNNIKNSHPFCTSASVFLVMKLNYIWATWQICRVKAKLPLVGRRVAMPCNAKDSLLWSITDKCQMSPIVTV